MLKKSLVAVAATCMSMAVMANNTIVEMKTSMGNNEIELFNDKAPISAKNFEDYTKAKFYNGTIFHRVIPGFMVQGGGMTADLIEKPTRPAIKMNQIMVYRINVALWRWHEPTYRILQPVSSLLMWWIITF